MLAKYSFEQAPSQIKEKALDAYIRLPVNREMVSYLADATRELACYDENEKPPTSKLYAAAAAAAAAATSTSSKYIYSETVSPDDDDLPSLEDFITNLVIMSNVQVPTLMSTLVYMKRFKSKLNPGAKGLRCSGHRIFLASLILTAKYLNDSSPKNKHWTSYTRISNEYYDFGFERTDVNQMERQLLFLLEWELRITTEHLYDQFEPFLSPIAQAYEEREREREREREMEREREREMEREREREMEMETETERQMMKKTAFASTVFIRTAPYPSPPASRAGSRTRSPSSYSRSSRGGGRRDRIDSLSTPPGLTFSTSSPQSSFGDSRHPSRSMTPVHVDDADVMVVDEITPSTVTATTATITITATTSSPSAASLTGGFRKGSHGKTVVPYDMSNDELGELQEEEAHDGKSKRLRIGRNLVSKMFGTVSVR